MGKLFLLTSTFTQHSFFDLDTALSFHDNEVETKQNSHEIGFCYPFQNLERELINFEKKLPAILTKSSLVFISMNLLFRRKFKDLDRRLIY